MARSRTSTTSLVLWKPCNVLLHRFHNMDYCYEIKEKKTDERWRGGKYLNNLSDQTGSGSPL
jgi:hypothetical protein